MPQFGIEETAGTLAGGSFDPNRELGGGSFDPPIRELYGNKENGSH